MRKIQINYHAQILSQDLSMALVTNIINQDPSQNPQTLAEYEWDSKGHLMFVIMNLNLNDERSGWQKVSKTCCIYAGWAFQGI